MSEVTGRCAFCGELKLLHDFGGQLVCELCGDKLKKVVAHEIAKLAAPYIAQEAKNKKALKEAKE